MKNWPLHLNHVTLLLTIVLYTWAYLNATILNHYKVKDHNKVMKMVTIVVCLYMHLST